ncbi:MAG: NAD-dependent epimerase/dehydratase family protein [Candidatus Saccharimonadales bacterium]
MSNTQTILVTGINGFVGHHLAAELKSRNLSVIGLGHDGRPTEEVSKYIDTYIGCDLTNEAAVKEVDFSKVDVIIHLAGLASQGMSFAEPRRFIADNSAMIINLFEAAMSQQLNHKPRFIVVSSGAVYDNNQPMPLTEDSRTTNASPYVISKLLTEDLCGYYQSRGFDCVIARPFNHIGPGQSPGFLLPDLVSQIREATESKEPMKVGNLKSRRDYTDVRDVVKAYALLATTEKLHHRLYNICSGGSTSGEELLAMITKELYAKKVNVVVDPNKLRPNDPPEIYGSYERLAIDTGWKPTLPLETTIRDFIKG